MKITPDYVVGFTDGEGCFQIIVKKTGSGIGYQITPQFTLTQGGEEGKKIIKEIRDFLDAGRVYTYPEEKYRWKDRTKLSAQGLEDLKKLKIFFDEHPPKVKRKIYEIWSHAVDIYEELMKTEIKARRKELLLDLVSLRTEAWGLFKRRKRKITAETLEKALNSSL